MQGLKFPGLDNLSIQRSLVNDKTFIYMIFAQDKITVKVKVTQSCRTLWDPMDYTVHGILQGRIMEWVTFPFSRDWINPGMEHRSPTLQADSLPAEPPGSPKILEWVAYPFSSGSSQPRNQTRVSCFAGGLFTSWANREALKSQ